VVLNGFVLPCHVLKNVMPIFRDLGEIRVNSVGNCLAILPFQAY